MAKKKSDTGKKLFDSQDAAPAMPEGFYSGDKPNTRLRAFIEEHASPFNGDEDAYNVSAFNQPITTTKVTAIYNMHGYHQGKKPHDAIRQYIRHFTNSNDIVMDPFSGSGGTSLAALMEGRKAVAIDRSPAATFLTKNHCTVVDAAELRRVFDCLLEKIRPELKWLYETRCDRCDGKADTDYTVYSQVFQCPRCLKKIPLFDCRQVDSQTAAGKPKKANACPHCYDKGHTEIIKSQSQKFGSVPVMVRYRCLEGCKPQYGERRHNDEDSKKKTYFEKYDLGEDRGD